MNTGAGELMTTFGRSFPEPAGWTKNAGVRRLFDNWALPGTHAGSTGLRIGIRAGYLNFYVQGQSVAKLSITRTGEPRVEVHEAYCRGLLKNAPRPEKLTRNRRLVGEEITPGAVDKWITTAASYASAEKKYVDELVAANPGTIDLEMALPADSRKQGAPRMDLVIARGDRIEFWEAKCSDNGELRAKLDTPYEVDAEGKYVRGIHVIYQLCKYQDWMGLDAARPLSVASAYRATAGILTTLADEFERPGNAARGAWAALAEAKQPEVVLPPGVAVGEYCVGWSGPADADPFKQKARSFTPYAERLRQHGATVVRHGRGDDKALPILAPGMIRCSPGQAT